MGPQGGNAKGTQVGKHKSSRVGPQGGAQRFALVKVLVGLHSREKAKGDA